MLTVLIIVALGVLAYLVTTRIMKSGKTEKSIDLQEALAPKTDIHAEIAKVAEEFKAQTAVAPVVEASVAKTKEPKSKKPAAPKQPAKQPADKKPAAPKMKSTPKKGK